MPQIELAERVNRLRSRVAVLADADKSHLRIGVVSDTHGYLDPRLIAAFEGVDLILHAGDVGSEAVLEGLRAIARVYAVQGNNDVPLGGLGLPTHLDVSLAGIEAHLVHELPHASPTPTTTLVVFGHSHKQLAEWRGTVLHLNPGAAGRQGFHKLQTATILSIEPRRRKIEIQELTLGPRLAKAR
jgi:putative phosphoesterase